MNFFVVFSKCFDVKKSIAFSETGVIIIQIVNKNLLKNDNKLLGV
jgi:hypothetical protein